jgi:nicotinate dehydrogenase subunit B
MAYVMAAAGASGEPAAKLLPGSLHVNRRLGQWLRFTREGKVEVYSGKVELGQGILTALAQIVAEELDLRFDQVRMVAASTATSPNEAVTSGSLSIQESGAALRQACAEARQLYLQAAAKFLQADAAHLRVLHGDIVHADARRTSYWALASDALLDREASGEAPSKPRNDYALVGISTARPDLPAKVFGERRFIHDMVLPGMRYARMVRPAAPAARLESLGLAAEKIADAGIADAEIVRDGSVLAVLAKTEHLADRAADIIGKQVTWGISVEAVLPDEQHMAQWLKQQPAETRVVATHGIPQGEGYDPENGEPQRNQPENPANPANPASPDLQRYDLQAPATVRTVKSSYSKPYIAHGSMAPSCALARFDGARLEVWTHSQGIYNLRRDLARAFDMAVDDVIVQHVEGAGCYGHNGADDVAWDAAWLARAKPGVAVRVQWSRADELAWAPFGPAMAVELEADVDAHGNVLAWRHSVWSNGHSNRPGRAPTPALLGSWHTANPFPVLAAINAPLAAGGGAERNAIPSYDFPAWHVVNHRILNMPLRTSALRALGALANVFAAESFMDELATAAGRDPVEFRLASCTDLRGREVIERAVARSGWRGADKPEGIGRGMGFARYKNTGAWCAVVAEVEAGQEIRVRRLTIAVDVGLVINPDGVRNQIEGGAIQATSWTLKEAVRFDRQRVTSDSWEAYPVLRFAEVPAVDIALIDSAEASLGAGEASLGPTAAAIGNAVADALGLRVRELPITTERIVRMVSLLA